MERLSVIPQEKEASARKRGELESGRKILEEKQRENQKITENCRTKKEIWLKKVFEDILANTISKKIRARIQVPTMF